MLGKQFDDGYGSLRTDKQKIYINVSWKEKNKWKDECYSLFIFIIIFCCLMN